MAAPSFASPEEAAHHFAMAFQETASCVTEARFNYPATHPLDRTRAVILASGADVRLSDGDLYLYAAHHYAIAADRESAGYLARTGAYYYSVNSDEAGGEIGAWHWHPQGVSWCAWPHLHSHSRLGPHPPTGRVAFEQIVRFLIRDCEVPVRRSDWDEVLTRNEADWRDRRSWA